MSQSHEALLQAQFEFEQSWVRGEPFDVREFAESNADLGPGFLADLVILDCDCRWFYASNEFYPVEVYRGKFPEIVKLPDVLLELVCIEILNCPDPNEEKFAARFPKIELEIRELFKLLPQLPNEERSNLVDSIRQSRHASQRITIGSNPSVSEGIDEVVELPKLSKGESIRFADECLILAEIGEGSHKWVFHAVQASTGQSLAVKQLKRTSMDLCGRFVSEGRAQASLDHQSIPPTMLLGPEQGEPTMVAERMIHGTPWSELLASNEFSLQRNLDVLLTVARAAKYAHRERGIVHRDIKPANVLIVRHDEVYLVDWGLAVRFGNDAQHLQDSQVRHVDRENGAAAGTPAYMSPESALGQWDKCAATTDVFLLGAILYEILAGRPPYMGRERTAFLRAATAKFPELSDDAPGELKSIVHTAMARDPAHRYQDAGEFANALEQYISHRAAEEQHDRAREQLVQFRERNRRTKHLGSMSHAVVTDLIAIADQFRQVGQSWKGHVLGEENQSLDAAVAVSTFANTGIDLAREQECSVRRELVEQAMSAGDLVLAESQVVELDGLNDPNAIVLGKRVLAEKAKRRRHHLQRRAFALLAAFLLVAASGLWVLQSRAVTRAALAETEKTKLISQVQIAEEEAARKDAEKRALIAENERQIAEARVRENRARLASLQTGRRQEKAVSSRLTRFSSGEAALLGSILAQSPNLDTPGDRILLREATENAFIPTHTSSRRIMTGVLTISPNGKWLISGDFGESGIRVWSCTDWTQSFVLLGHKVPDQRGGLWGTIRSVVFNPDNEDEMVSAGLDGSVRVWDLDLRKQIRSYQGNEEDDSHLAIMSMSISPRLGEKGNREVVMGRRDGKILWLDLATLAPTGPIEVDGHSSHVTDLQFRTDGLQLASTGGDGLVKLWSDDGKLQVTLPHPSQERGDDPIEMFVVSYSSDGKRLAAGGSDGQIHLWDPVEQKLFRSLDGHPPAPNGKKSIRTISWQDNQRLLSGASDGTIRQWDAQDGKLLNVLKGHGENMYGNRVVWHLAVNPKDVNKIASCGNDDAIRIWDVDRAENTHALEGMSLVGQGVMSFPPTRSAYAPGNETLVTAGMSVDAYIRAWDLETLRERRTFTGLPELGEENMFDRIHAVAIRPDGKQFVSAEPTGELIYWDVDSGEILRKVKAHEPKQLAEVADVGLPPPLGITSVAWSPNGQFIASTGHDLQLKLWNAATGKLVAQWSHEDPEHRIELPPGVSNLPDNLKQLLSSQLNPPDQHILFSRDDQKLITSGRDKIIRVWDIATRSIKRRLTHIEQTTAFALSWDGEQIAAGTSKGQIVIWNFETGAVVQASQLEPLMIPERFAGPLPLKTEMKHQGNLERGDWAPRVTSLGFSPNGEILAVAQGDGSISKIDVDSGSVTHRGIGHEIAPIGMQNIECFFTKSGRLLTVGDDKTIRRWDLSNWSYGENKLAEPKVVGGGRELASGPDGQWAVADNRQQLVRWKNSSDESPAYWAPEKDALYSVTHIPGSNELLVGTMFGRAIRFDGVENSPIFTFSGPERDRDFPTRMVNCVVAISPDGKTAASTWNNDIELWRVADGTFVRKLNGTGKAVMAVAFRPDGNQLAASDYDGGLRLWDLTDENGEQPEIERLGPQQATGLDYSPDGKRLVQAGQILRSQAIVIWDSSNGDPVKSLPAGTFKVFDADFSPDGNWLATCGADAAVRIWRVSIDDTDVTKDVYEPFEVLFTARADDVEASAWLTTVAFSADSNEVATAGLDGPIRVYKMDAIIAQESLTADELLQRTERITGLRVEQDHIVPMQQIRLVPTK